MSGPSSDTGAAGGVRGRLTMANVRKHRSVEGGAWMVVDGQVYDITHHVTSLMKQVRVCCSEVRAADWNGGISGKQEWNLLTSYADSHAFSGNAINP